MNRKLVLALASMLLVGMLNVAFNIQRAKAEPTTTVVPDDYPTIQTAINAANPGDTIFVHAGLYYEHVIISKSISLIGEDKHSTIIDGNLTGHVINVTASNVKITGFSIQRSYQYTPGYGICISQYGTDNTVTDNIMINNERGILLDHSSNNMIFENSLANNGGGVYLENSFNNMISRNNIQKNEYSGIYIDYYSSDNFVMENNVTNNGEGMFVAGDRNTISRNTVMNNAQEGILLSGEDDVFFDNNIINNEHGVAEYFDSSHNIFYHNNFVGNTYQVDYDMEGVNIWDNGYPSGGNYWSDFGERYPDVEDAYRGLYQNETGSDGVWDHFYWITSGNRDNYPLVTSYTPSMHELVVFALATPASITLGSSSLLNATVTNQGSSDETNVEFLLLINGTIVDSANIPLLQVGNSHMLSYLWTPTVKGTYNVTAYAHPLPGETSAENNQKTRFTTVWAIGVKAGDWIEYDYTATNAPLGTTMSTWMKVEILSVEGTTVAVRLTMRMSNGTEGSENLTLDFARDLPYGTGGTFDTFFGFGFVIPANSTVGKDYIYIVLLSPAFMLGKQIDGETTGTYAVASRTVVYATFSYIGDRYGNNPLEYYWDKQTGVMVEASATLNGMSVTAKATETNIWEAAPSGFPIEPIYLYILAALAIIIAVGAAAFIMRRRKKPPEEAKSPQI